MPLTRAQKGKIIEDLKEKFAKQKIILFVNFAGLKVKDFSTLRKNLKKEGSEIKVTKKTLLKLVLKNAGLKVDFQKLKGEVATIFGYRDEISPAKILYQFSEIHANLKILGGIFEKKFLSSEKVVELAKLPQKEELLGRLIGSISAPLSNFVGVLKGNIKGLLYVLAKAKT